MLTRKSHQKGGFIIEALIAMAVAGVGLFALMQLQGKITGGISVSKAREEAMQIAQQRGESLRAYVAQAQFSSDTSNGRTTWEDPPTEDSVDNIEDGVNAKFYEEWMIRDAADGNYKEVMVRVSWYDETQESDGSEGFKSVSLNNFITFQDPATISGIWSDITGNSPEPPVRTRMNVGIEQVEAGAEDDIRDPQVDIKEFQGLADNELFKRVNSLGNWELYGLDTDGDAVVVLTAFGGIIHKSRGKIHFEETRIDDEDLARMLTIASSPAYCEYPLVYHVGLDEVTAPGYTTGCKFEFEADGTKNYLDKCIEYVCYLPGDCSNEVDGSGNFDLIDGLNNDCKFNESGEITDSDKLKQHLEEIKDLGLNGGWYGKVGLFGVPETPFDDVITGDSCEDPARFYVSHRLCDPGSCGGLTVPVACEYQKDCTFQDPADAGVWDYSGYVSHCVGSPPDQEIIDGYCVNGTPYAIYENEGINGSHYYNHFWLIDGDLNTKSCTENKLRFAKSNPDYLADHNIVRILYGDNDTGDDPDSAADGDDRNRIVVPETSRSGLLDPPLP